jgi:hypothetical protein
MTKLFGSYTYTWWQMGVFKLSLLAIGLLVGAYFASAVMSAFWVLLTIAVISSAYIIVISLRATEKK